MAKRKSAGVLLYRSVFSEIEVFLVLHGGPYWTNKDLSAWSIPKGEFDEPETPLAAAVREFKEETGTSLSGSFTALQPVVQKGGKQVFAFAVEGDLDATTIQSNTFMLEWPPKSGKWQSFPEIAKGAWFSLRTAALKINPAQLSFLNELEQLLLKNQMDKN